jgi:hypothetical protein
VFLLTLKDRKSDGAYAVHNKMGEKVLVLFEEEDDANRYAMMLEEEEDPTEMEVVEVDAALAIRTCKMYNYKYSIVTPNDIVIPPKLNDNISENPLA